jgi:pyruvate ferredoxin oxidoreductase delta subunit
MPKEKIEIGCKSTKNTLDRKTGSWRTSFHPVVTDKCKGCSVCVSVCPEGIIKINPKTKKAEVDYDYCKGCLICMNECPFKAIEKEEEKK